MEPTTRYRLPRSAVLRGRDVFGRLFREGDGLRRGQLVVKYAFTSGESSEVHTGFVVRRNAGSAVKRNRLRRLLREAYRMQRHRFSESVPVGRQLRLVILWSGSGEQALRPSLDSIQSDMRMALGAISSRIRKRADEVAGEP
ncbi:MAG: ribonuclease P protein component [Bacteroidota bacterium]